MRGALLAGLLVLAAPARAQTADEIVQKVIASDPFGLSGADVAAHATLTDKAGSSSQLAFAARSLNYDPPLAKSLVRFSAPPDLAGAGFLQVQKRTGDDERFLFMPDLKRARRISGNLRATSFMGTDFTFADLDRRDLRESNATLLGDENLGKYPCWHLQVLPSRTDSQYSKMELWVRKDNFLPVKVQMYNRAKVLLKTLTASEVKRVAGHWFISKSKMVNHVESHSTDLVLDKIAPGTDVHDEEFTVRELEKL